MNDYRLEEQVLSGLLAYPEEFDPYFDQLRPEDFLNPNIRQIYQTAAAYRKEHGRVSAGDLKLEQTERDYVMNCIQSFIYRHAMGDIVKALKRESKEKRLYQSVMDLMTFGADGELLPALEKLVETEKLNENSRDYEGMMVNQMIRFSEELFSTGERKSRVMTGFSRLDESLSGLRLGTVSYVGARPSTGKTAFALNILKNQLRTDKRCVMFSLEMSVNQIYERILSDLMTVNYGLINKGKLKEKQKKDMLLKLDQLLSRRKTFIIDDQYTIEAIGGTIADLKPDFVIIDFLQCVRTMRRFQARRNEIDYISQEIKRLAKRYHCHIMGLSQMARGDKTNQPPKMNDLKESGGLEQDGDYIMILHRPYVMDREKHQPEETELSLDKNKYGATGRMDMRFIGEYQRFLEVDKHHG